VCKFLAAPVEFYGDEKGWVKNAPEKPP